MGIVLESVGRAIVCGMTADRQLAYDKCNLPSEMLRTHRLVCHVYPRSSNCRGQALARWSVTVSHMTATTEQKVLYHNVQRASCTDRNGMSSWRTASLTFYSPVVTICTASLTSSNSTFCPHSVFMCFVWISEQTAIISLYSINWLVSITEI